MSSSNLRPKWWQLYLTFPLLIALFVLDARLKLSARGHQAVQLGILLLVYGLVHLWLKVNASALSRMDQDHGRVRVLRVLVHPPPDEEVDRRPIFELPVAEDKGMLSDTFEMDCISQELKKE